MKIYKLTRADGTTHNGMQWGEGVTNTVEWGGRLCEAGCLHGYRSPELAVFLQSIHVDSEYTELWECSTPKNIGRRRVKNRMCINHDCQKNTDANTDDRATS